jgi:TFIIF-interacting CTD phosphatase-like protein
MYRSDFDKIPLRPITDKCIVLDLDETLVHSHSDPNIDFLKELKIYSDPSLLDIRERTYRISMDDVVHKKGTGDKTEMWGVIRPHVREFLIACFNYFKIVIIWSAGRKNYVNAIVDYLFRDLKYPAIVWNFNDLERSSDGMYIKPLEKLIQKVPGLSKYMSLENTFIVDDRVTVFQEPNPKNGIEIPPYKPDLKKIRSLRSDDTALSQLVNWFHKPEVKNSKDVRELDKSKIFE